MRRRDAHSVTLKGIFSTPVRSKQELPTSVFKLDEKPEKIDNYLLRTSYSTKHDENPDEDDNYFDRSSHFCLKIFSIYSQLVG